MSCSGIMANMRGAGDTMTHPIGTTCLLAMTVLAMAAAPARADERDNRGDRDRQNNEHWRGERNYGGYHQGPLTYYPPPPIVYQPYGYYQQPGASLNLNFPLGY